MQLELGTFYTVTVILHCRWGARVNVTKCSVCQVPHSFMWSPLIGKCHHLQLAKVQPQVIFSIKPGFPDGKPLAIAPLYYSEVSLGSPQSV